MLKEKTLNRKKRNKNGADEEDADFEAKQNISPKLLKFGLKMCCSIDNHIPQSYISD